MSDDGVGSIHSYVASLKENIQVWETQERLRTYRKERPLPDRPKQKLITETSEVDATADTLRFKLRWDEAFPYNDGNEDKVGVNANRVDVAIRKSQHGHVAFVHAQPGRLLAKRTQRPLDEVLFGRGRNLMALTPTSDLFTYLETHEVRELLYAGIKRTETASIRTVRLGGDFRTKEAEWVALKGTGSVALLRYVAHDGKTYGVYQDGTFGISGEGVCFSDMEDFVLERVIRHLR